MMRRVVIVAGGPLCSYWQVHESEEDGIKAIVHQDSTASMVFVCVLSFAKDIGRISGDRKVGASVQTY
jgi:hypothetical protein